MDNKQIIAEAIELLKKIKLKDSNINVEAETGYDETTFIGTDMGFIALSKFLLKFVLAYYTNDQSNNEYSFSKDVINNVQCFMSGELHHFFDDTGEIYPVCACMAKSDEDKELIVNEFK